MGCAFKKSGGFRKASEEVQLSPNEELDRKYRKNLVAMGFESDDPLTLAMVQVGADQ